MTTYRRIKSVELTTKIIKFIGDKTREVTVKEISEALNQPNGTIMCHLVTLEDANFLTKIGERYGLGSYIAFIWASTKSKKEALLKQTQNELKHLEIK